MRLRCEQAQAWFCFSPVLRAKSLNATERGDHSACGSQDLSSARAGASVARFGSRAEKLPVGTGFRMTSDSGHSSSESSRSAKLLVLPKTRFGFEQFHAPRWPNNATRLSGMEWLWPAKRA